MKFLLKHRLLLIFICIALVITIMAVASLFASGRITPISSLLGSVFKPFFSLMTSATDSVGSFYGNFGEYDLLLAENGELRLRIAELEKEVMALEKAGKENERLRELVGVKESNPDYELVSADITTRDISNWSRTITVNKGTSSGISVGNAVISAEGYLVGIVAEAARGWCTIITITDTDMRAGAYLYRTGQTAVAAGLFNSMLTGKLALLYLSLGDDLQIGDYVLTSGESGLLPKDIPIGHISAVREDANGMSVTAEITPVVMLDRLSVVYIITAFGDMEEQP